MILFHGTQALQALCKATQKWGMFINISYEKCDNPWGEVIKAAPYLHQKGKDPEFQIIGDGYGYLLFDSEEEMHTYYNQTVGDDGPTETNPYSNDLARVYALTCAPDGQFHNENT